MKAKCKKTCDCAELKINQQKTHLVVVSFCVCFLFYFEMSVSRPVSPRSCCLYLPVLITRPCPDGFHLCLIVVLCSVFSRSLVSFVSVAGFRLRFLVFSRFLLFACCIKSPFVCNQHLHLGPISCLIILGQLPSQKVA